MTQGLWGENLLPPISMRDDAEPRFTETAPSGPVLHAAERCAYRRTSHRRRCGPENCYARAILSLRNVDKSVNSVSDPVRGLKRPIGPAPRRKGVPAGAHRSAGRNTRMTHRPCHAFNKKRLKSFKSIATTIIPGVPPGYTSSTHASTDPNPGLKIVRAGSRADLLWSPLIRIRKASYGWDGEAIIAFIFRRIAARRF